MDGYKLAKALVADGWSKGLLEVSSDRDGKGSKRFGSWQATASFRDDFASIVMGELSVFVVVSPRGSGHGRGPESFGGDVVKVPLDLSPEQGVELVNEAAEALVSARLPLPKREQRARDDFEYTPFGAYKKMVGESGYVEWKGWLESKIAEQLSESMRGARARAQAMREYGLTPGARPKVMGWLKAGDFDYNLIGVDRTEERQPKGLSWREAQREVRNALARLVRARLVDKIDLDRNDVWYALPEPQPNKRGSRRPRRTSRRPR